MFFTLIAERYERRSLGITSNPQSRLRAGFGLLSMGAYLCNPMAAAAAMDRVVHHPVILEFEVSQLPNRRGLVMGSGAGGGRQE